MIFKFRFLVLLLLVGVSLAANPATSTPTAGCPECLTAAMRRELQLTQQQETAVTAINASFLRVRRQIVDYPPAVGQHTALLACWSDWREALTSVLAPTQMDLFDAWQSEFDLVGNGFQ